MNGLIDKLRGWVEDEAEHYTYRHLPAENPPVDPLLPYGSYFRVTLAQMFLRTERKWFKETFPAAHTSIRIQHADYAPVELNHVTHVPGQDLAKSIDLNNTVTGLVPYNGGTLEIDCGLLALHGKDYLDASIKMLGSFSELVAAPVSQALAITGKVATSVQDLFVGSDGEVQLNFGQTYAEGNPPRPGHYAAILATEAQLQGKTLSVEKDQLRANGQPFTGFDYLLFRIDAVKERSDWRMQEIQKNVKAAKKSYLRQKTEEGDEYRAAALVAVYDSRELSEADRARVEGMIRDELEPYRTGGRGAVGDEELEKSLDQIMEGAMSWEEGARRIAARNPAARKALQPHLGG